MRRIIILGLFLCLTFPGAQVCAEVVDDNWKDVFKFQTRMAEYGSAKAQYILGEMYAEGRGVKQDYTKAIEWYTKAQKNGHNTAEARIAQLKIKIANTRSNKKLAVKKARAEEKKSIIVKKIKARKTKVKRSKIRTTKLRRSKLIIEASKKSNRTKTKQRKIHNILAVEKVTQQPVRPDTGKKTRKNKTATPTYEDDGRYKNTHFDNYEDPFE